MLNNVKQKYLMTLYDRFKLDFDFWLKDRGHWPKKKKKKKKYAH